MKLSALDVVALFLTVAGGLNWGLIGLAGVNVVDNIFGMAVSRFIYIVVGLAALYVAWLWMKLEKR